MITQGCGRRSVQRFVGARLCRGSETADDSQENLNGSIFDLYTPSLRHTPRQNTHLPTHVSHTQYLV